MDPKAAQPSITKNPQQPGRSEKQFFRRNPETKRIGDAGDDIETDANVSGIKNGPFAYACLSWSIEIFETEFGRSKRYALEKRQSRTKSIIDLRVSPVSKDVGCQTMSEE
jgi:hypothetical protein